MTRPALRRALLTLIVLLAACGRPDAAPPPPPVPGITIALNVFPDTMFGIESQLSATSEVLSLVQPPCFTSLDDAYQPVCFTKLPSFADGDASVTQVTVDSSYQGRVLFSDGVTTTAGLREPAVLEQMYVTWTLRPDMRWEDGTPLTAHDFVFAAELYADPRVRNTNRFLLENTVAYEAPDDYTLVARTVPGYADSTYFLNALGPEPRHVLEGQDPADIRRGEYGREALAFGPYKVQTFERGKAITLVPNPHYWRADEGLPKIQRVTFTVIEDPQELLTALERGEVDVAGGNGLTMAELGPLEQLVEQGIVNAQYIPATSWEHIDFALERGDGKPSFFTDRRVRHAVAHAIDRRGLIDQLFSGKPTLTDSFILPTSWAYPPDGDGLATYDYDPERARGLLDAAGWRPGPDGLREKNGRAFNIELLTPRLSGSRADIAARIKQQLGEVGIDVSVIEAQFSVSDADWPDRYRSRAFDLALFSWQLGNFPPIGLYVCRDIPTAANGYSGDNITSYCNPEFDEAVYWAQVSTDRAQVLPGLHTAQRIFSEDVPTLPLYQHVTIGVSSPRVRGLQIDSTHPNDFWNIDEWTLAE